MAEAKFAQVLGTSPPSAVARGWSGWRRWLRSVQARAYRHAAANLFELSDLAAAALRQGQGDLPKGYVFRLANAEEFAACSELSGVALSECRRRGAAGDQCYAVFCGGCPVNLNWLHFGACYVYGLGLRIDAPRSDCYLYNIYTSPAHRGHGLYNCTQRQLLQLLADRGVSRIRQVVMVGNMVPTNALPKFGYVLSTVIRHTTVGGLRMTTMRDTSSGARACQFSCKAPAGIFRI
jgi:GNAT superfamily N-acetyltransferase